MNKLVTHRNGLKGFFNVGFGYIEQLYGGIFGAGTQNLGLGVEFQTSNLLHVVVNRPDDGMPLLFYPGGVHVVCGRLCDHPIHVQNLNTGIHTSCGH